MEQPVQAPARFSPTSPLCRLLVRRRDEVMAIAESYGASNVRVFGSTARGDDGAGSDIDLLVDLDPGVGLFDLERLQIAISNLLGVKVDVVPESMLNRFIAEFVYEEATPI